MAKTQRGEAMSVDDRLPPEIWNQILTKLPVKSILRCRSVCKKWYSLVSSPNFITYHAAQTLNHSITNRLIVHHHYLNTFLSEFSSHDESFVKSHEHDDITEHFRRGEVHIVGSCNGLVCLIRVSEHIDDVDVHSFLIWNPSIRKSVQVPNLSTADETLYRFGFGFDSGNGDYKVLRVGYYGPQYLDPVVCEIFDLRKGVWRDIRPPTTPRYVDDPGSSLYLHGSLHWIGCKDRSNYIIVSFNLSSEVSLEMGMPGDAEFRDVQDCDCYYISANNGYLSAALLRLQEGDVLQVCCSVWSMKEYGVSESWTKLFNIELPYARNDLGLLRFLENGVVFVLVMQDGDNDLVVYNPENRTSKALLSVDEVDGSICNVSFYKESLVLL